MGLDMYLEKDTYIGGKHAENIEVHIWKNGKKVDIDPKKLSSVTEDVGYWRKANQIHNWFVQNVQGGVDKCQRSRATLEELKELKEACLAVLKDNSKAAELLPVQTGFFFGSNEYDEYYFQDLEETVKIIEEVEKTDRYYDYYYQASW